MIEDISRRADFKLLNGPRDTIKLNFACKSPGCNKTAKPTSTYSQTNYCQEHRARCRICNLILSYYTTTANQICISHTAENMEPNPVLTQQNSRTSWAR